MDYPMSFLTLQRAVHLDIYSLLSGVLDFSDSLQPLIGLFEFVLGGSRARSRIGTQTCQQRIKIIIKF